MRLERVLRALESLGLSHLESQVYVYLAKAGPSRSNEMSIELKLPKQQLNEALRGLKEKGIVVSRPEHIRLFSAIAFEELLNLFIKNGTEKAKAIRDTKQELMGSWVDLTKQNGDS